MIFALEGVIYRVGKDTWFWIDGTQAEGILDGTLTKLHLTTIVASETGSQVEIEQSRVSTYPELAWIATGGYPETLGLHGTPVYRVPAQDWEAHDMDVCIPIWMPDRHRAIVDRAMLLGWTPKVRNIEEFRVLGETETVI